MQLAKNLSTIFIESCSVSTLCILNNAQHFYVSQLVFTFTRQNQLFCGTTVSTISVVFTLRHSGHFGGRKQMISNQLLLFVHQQYMRHYIGDAQHLYVSLMLFFSLLLSLLVSVVSFQLGAMLACHNYWHWAVYHIEKVRTLSLLYHPNFRKHQTTLEHCRRHSDNIGAFLRKMFR